MRYLSVCSGIEAATVAWHGLGWQPVAFCEFDAGFPSTLLAHRYPDVPNLGDLTTWRDWSFEMFAHADVLVGGTPCQAFSVAGLRRSLDDERGNLSLIYVELANEIDACRDLVGLPPAIIVWENVPGVLSTKDNAFGCFLGGLAGEDVPLEPAGGRWTDAGCVLGPQRAVAWRILDAQYFGVAQRRRRVFVVASARDGFDPTAVLFEREGMRRDSAPSREAGEGTADRAARSVALRGRDGGGTAELGGDVGLTLRASAGGGDKPHCLAPTLPARTRGGGGLGTDFDCDGGLVAEPVCMAHGQANAEVRTDGATPTLVCVCMRHPSYAPPVANCLETTSHDYSRADGFTMISVPRE